MIHTKLTPNIWTLTLNSHESIRISHPIPSSQPNTITLFLSALTSPRHLNKMPHHPLQIFLRLTTQSQVKCLQETMQSPLSSFLQKPYSHPPHPNFHLFHHCIPIHVEEPRGHDTTLSQPLSVLKHSLSLPFTPTQARLFTYIQKFATHILHSTDLLWEKLTTCFDWF